MRDTNTTRWWLWTLPLPLVWWAALAFATHWTVGGGLAALLVALNAAMAQPWVLRVTAQTPRSLTLFTLAYAVLAVIVATDLEVSTRNGEEHGSARWSA